MLDAMSLTISPATARAALRINGGCPRMSEVAQIIAEVAELSGVPEADILKHSQVPHMVMARDLVAWELRHQLGLSYSQIGRAMNRDHKTALLAVRRENARRDGDSA